MKRTSTIILKHTILAVFLATGLNTQAAVKRAVSSGDWEDASTWQLGLLPSNGDSIVIPGGKTVEVTTMLDYSSGAEMRLNIFGELTFQTGKKLTLPTGSLVYLQVSAWITPGNGGGSSNVINVGTQMVWHASFGPITGYLVMPVAPLPVEMIGFNATVDAQSVLISWETATEVNNEYFDVERGTDGIHFESIGRVAGHGTSSTGFKYSYRDKSPLTGTNYYRLKQVDYDKKYVYTRVLYCRFKTSVKKEVQIFPNPTKGEVYLTVDSDDIESLIEVMIADARGNVISKQQVQNIPGAKGIPVTREDSQMKPGIYFITVTINEEPFRKQLVVY